MNAKVQAFDTKWDEVLSPVTDSILESLYKTDVAKSEELKYFFVQVYVQETRFGDKKYDYCKLKLVVQKQS